LKFNWIDYPEGSLSTSDLITIIRNHMSITARLYIEGHDKGIKILSCDFSFSQDVDSQGKVNSKVRAGLINLTIPGIDDTEIIQWMFGRDDKKDCRITFSGFIDTGPHRSIEFKDAYLISYHESYSEASDIVINLTLSSRIIDIKGVVHESSWTPSGT
jgi:hypothetical protein